MLLFHLEISRDDESSALPPCTTCNFLKEQKEIVVSRYRLNGCFAYLGPGCLRFT